MYFMERSPRGLARARKAWLNGLYPKSGSFDLPEYFPEISRATLEDLLGGHSSGPSYSVLYPRMQDKSDQMDVARAMSYLQEARGNRAHGHFDLVTVRIIGGIFQDFVKRLSLRKEPGLDPFAKPAPPVFELAGKSKIKGTPGKKLSLSEFQQFYLAVFLDSRPDRDLLLDFRLLAKKATVELRLEVGASGNLCWEARGVSSLKKSHLALRDQLQSATADFKTRLKWLEEYEGRKQRPVFDPDDSQEIMRSLDRICEVGPELVALQSGIVCADDSLPLIEGNGKILFERCLDCDAAVMLSADYAGPASVEMQELIAEVCYKVSKNLQGIHSYSGCSGLLATCSQTGVSFSVIG